MSSDDRPREPVGNQIWTNKHRIIAKKKYIMLNWYFTENRNDPFQNIIFSKTAFGFGSSFKCVCRLIDGVITNALPLMTHAQRVQRLFAHAH